MDQSVAIPYLLQASKKQKQAKEKFKVKKESRGKCFKIVLIAAMVMFALSGFGCSAHQHVAKMDTSYKVSETPRRNETCYVLAPEDARENPYEMNDFGRAWGYSIDSNLQNKINFSSEKPLSSNLGALIMGALQSMGYDAVLINKKDEVSNPESNSKIIAAYIDRFWINVSSTWFGLRIYQTDICIRMEVNQAGSSALPKQVRIEIFYKDYRSANWKKTIIKKTEEVLSVNIERLKEIILAKLENEI